MSDASPAAAALAANQDAEFALALRSAMLEAVHAFAGPQTAMRARMPVQLLADTIYALASLVDVGQTPGEQFADVVMARGNGVASRGWRALVLLLRTAPTVLFRAVPLAVRANSPWRQAVRHADALLPELARVERALIALGALRGGGVLALLLGLRLVANRPAAARRTPTQRLVFGVIGAALLARAALMLGLALRQTFLRRAQLQQQKKPKQRDNKNKNKNKNKNNKNNKNNNNNKINDNEEEEDDKEGNKALVDDRSPAVQQECVLCLAPCDAPTTTPCGHIFCWSCIGEWCAIHNSCALCRANVDPQDLVRIVNL